MIFKYFEINQDWHLAIVTYYLKILISVKVIQEYFVYIKKVIGCTSKRSNFTLKTPLDDNKLHTLPRQFIEYLRNLYNIA